MICGTLFLPAQSKADHLRGVDDFFTTYVKDGRVDYASIQQNQAQLATLTDQMTELDFSAMEKDERLAILINSYNLYVIAGVIEKYPVKSPLDISNFFDRKVYQLGNKTVSLNQIEKQLIIAEYQDARVHFALVCGALGCPSIRNEAYTPEAVDSQLDQQTTQALNNPEFVRLSSGVLSVSQIFEWYSKDFGGSKASTLAYISSRSDLPIPADAKVKYYEYDWTLNDL